MKSNSVVKLSVLFLTMVLPLFLGYQSVALADAQATTTLPSILPVVPGAYGFAMDTPAGRGGKVFVVTNLNVAGPGSLKAAVDAYGPRVVVFEVSGVIELNSNLIVRNPYITIAGQTAPSPGIMIRGAGITVTTHDVLIQHMRVRPGDGSAGPSPDNRDAMQIEGNAHNVVIDHSTFGWSTDETVAVWGKTVGDVSFSSIIAAEGLDRSIHPEGNHGFSTIFGQAAPNMRVSAVDSLFANSRGRMPLSSAKVLFWANNLHYNRLQRFSHLANYGIYTYNTFVGNLYVDAPAYRGSTRAIDLRSDVQWTVESKIYMDDNYSPNYAVREQWDMVSNQTPFTKEQILAPTPLHWFEGFQARPHQEVQERVLANAGARPADRDSAELRLMDEIITNTGKIKNTIEEAGGWPVYAENRRKLYWPSDPSGDIDNDGYTNLEEWLHYQAALVEGRPIVEDIAFGEVLSDQPEAATASFPVVKVTTLPAKLEAEENTVLYDATPSDINEGFSGRGFVDYENKMGSYPGIGTIEWYLEVEEAGMYKLDFRYALKSGNRFCEVRVNEAVVKSMLPFPGTGAFTIWGNSSTEYELKAGVNVISLTGVTRDGGPNVDYLMLTKL